MRNVRRWLAAIGVLAVAGGAQASSPAEPRDTPAPATAAAVDDASGLRLGGLAGYGSAATSGFVLRAEGDVPFRSLTERLTLSWAGAVGLSRLTRSESAFGVARGVTVMVLDVVPSARVSLPLGERVTGYAEVGLGVYRAGTTVRQEYAFGLGSTRASTSELGTMAHLGAGLWVRTGPRLDLGGGFGLEPHFGSQFGETTLVFHAGAMYRL